MTTARIPLAAKLAYTAWMLVWVPVYWLENGWTNFLWICDLANFVILAALWSESALLASSQLAGILVIQAVWALDYLGRLALGFHPVGGTEYMFDESRPLWLRAFSLFHLWTVPLLAWMVLRLGHDRRGWLLQAAILVPLFPLGQQLGTREQNLNWMWSPFGVEQTWLPPLAFAFLAVPITALLAFWPAEQLIRRLLEPRAWPRSRRPTKGSALSYQAGRARAP